MQLFYKRKMAASFCRKYFLNYKNGLFKTQYRTSYVVLIPEVPEDVAENEIFAKSGNMPDFDKAHAKDCKHLMVRKSQFYDIGVWELAEQIRYMLNNNEKIDLLKNIVGPLDLLFVPFLSTWGLIYTLYHANPTFMPASMFHSLNERAQEIKKDKYNMEPIFKACKQLLENESDKYNEEEKRILQKYVWEGKLLGLHLNAEDQDKLAEVIRKIEMRTESYVDKWTLSHLHFRQVLHDREAIIGFPPDFCRNAAVDVEKPDEGPWILSLKPRIYNRYMEYCDTRQCRFHMWLSKRQICSKFGDRRYRAEMEVEDIRKFKFEYAKLLGYDSYAHLMVDRKMAKKLENIEVTLGNLLEKAKIGQEIEVYELEKFANGQNFKGQIEMWDIPFWSRLQKRELYQFDEIALQEYFPLSQVLLGLFALCEQLFGIEIEEEKNPNVWHQDVRYFNVIDEKTKNILGGFYFDPYARKSKTMTDEEGGLVFILGVSSSICGTLPAVSMIFDFAPPTEDRPSLLLFREVEDLFTKFGAVLQHILAETHISELNIMHYFEGDASYICSKFLQHWLYEPGTLESVTGHYNTGEPLPSHILEGVCKMQHHMAGTKLCQDIYAANLDFQLHLDEEYCMPIARNIWPEHFLFELGDNDHHPFSMKDVIAENKGCANYDKIWSKVIAADAFSAFAEIGFKNHEEIALLGKRFRSTYFALAGGCQPGEVFRRFRGRDPLISPLLNVVGLADKTDSPRLTDKTVPSISPATETTKIEA